MHHAFKLNSVKDKEQKNVQSKKKRLLVKVDQLSIDCDFFASTCEAFRLKVR